MFRNIIVNRKSISFNKLKGNIKYSFFGKIFTKFTFTYNQVQLCWYSMEMLIMYKCGSERCESNKIALVSEEVAKLQVR